MKYQRRTDDDRIAELNAKIEGIRERAVRKAARAKPAVRQATIAVRAIEKALEAQPGDPLGGVLEQAREAITAERGGQVACRLYSLILSCKQAGVDPEAYIEDALGRLSTTRASDIASLTPWAWAAARA